MEEVGPWWPARGRQHLSSDPRALPTRKPDLWAKALPTPTSEGASLEGGGCSFSSHLGVSSAFCLPPLTLQLPLRCCCCW